MRTLSDAGLQMDRKVADYLASGGRLGHGGRTSRGSRRQTRTVNANDDLVVTELGGRSTTAREYDAKSARRVARAAADGEDFDIAPPPSAKQQYQEFEKLLAQRDDTARATRPGEPKPERDTKRAVDRRRLRNLGNL